MVRPSHFARRAASAEPPVKVGVQYLVRGRVRVRVMAMVRARGRGRVRARCRCRPSGRKP